MLIEKDSNRGFRFILALILSIFITIIVAFNSGFLNFIDSSIIDLIQGQQSGFKDVIYTIFSAIASPTMDIIWSLVIAFIIWGFKYKLPALWILFTIIGGDVIGEIIKLLIQRPRPIMHLAKDTGYSFPSGHVLGATLVIAFIWIWLVPMLKSNQARIAVKTICVILLIIIMFSRVYLNAHYPTDTIGALLISYSWLEISEWLYVKYASRFLKYKIVKNTKY